MEAFESMAIWHFGAEIARKVAIWRIDTLTDFPMDVDSAIEALATHHENPRCFKEGRA